MLGLQRRRRPERAHLGHSPALAHVDAVTRKCLDHRRRHRRTARQDPLQSRAAHAGGRKIRLEAEPHGRHAEAVGHALGFEQLVETSPVETRSRQNELGPVHRRGVRNAPGAGVKHRHHRTNHVVGRDRYRIGKRDPERMQHRRAVAVEGTLGVAGGPRGVAERRRRSARRIRATRNPRPRPRSAAHSRASDRQLRRGQRHPRRSAARNGNRPEAAKRGARPAAGRSRRQTAAGQRRG